jgi:predicted transposase/invertase (TIGR01784 family)
MAKKKNAKKKTFLSPHDKFIRSVLTNPRAIKDFFKNNLPAPIQSMIDCDTIEPQKESFINDKLRLQITDLLYSVNIHGEPGYIYLLLEHASKPDRLLPFRMLKYITAVMDNHLIKTGSSTLPVVYPLILYTGKQPFNHSMDLFDLFERNRSTARDIYKSPYQLVDLSHASDEELAKYERFRVAALLAKHIHDKDMLPFIKEVAVALRELESQGELNYIYLSLSYIVEAGQISDEDEFRRTVAQGLTYIDEDKIMIIGERLKKEGFEQGMAQGKAESMIIGERLRKEGYEQGIKQAMSMGERLRKEGYEQGIKQAMSMGERLRKEGYEQGAEKKAMLIAKNMLADNLPLELIAKFTGIPLTVLERFKH